MSFQTNTVIIVPSLDPDDKLLRLLSDLTKNGFSNIIVINDGSSEQYDPFFLQASETYGCTVLKHCVNQGKGRALKTAFNYYLEHFSGTPGVITVDSDGQHRLEDIQACAQALSANPDKLILGCRDFDKENVPFRSKFGNVLTRNVFSMFCGIRVSDTQTGLRALSPALVQKFLSTKGERFEYEMNMLIDCKELEIPIMEVPIQTIYIEENASSHFNPLLDSARIYSVFLKFIFSSLSSFVIDIVLFTLFVALLDSVVPAFYILAATVLARAVSSVCNYLINKESVFKSKAAGGGTLVKYYILAVCQMLCSAGLVTLVHSLLPSIGESAIKIAVDILLFFISFKIQREWVFRRSSRRSGKKG